MPVTIPWNLLEVPTSTDNHSTVPINTSLQSTPTCNRTQTHQTGLQPVLLAPCPTLARTGRCPYGLAYTILLNRIGQVPTDAIKRHSYTYHLENGQYQPQDKPVVDNEEAVESCEDSDNVEQEYTPTLGFTDLTLEPCDQGFYIDIFSSATQALLERWLITRKDAEIKGIRRYPLICDVEESIREFTASRSMHTHSGSSLGQDQGAFVQSGFSILPPSTVTYRIQSLGGNMPQVHALALQGSGRTKILGTLHAEDGTWEVMVTIVDRVEGEKSRGSSPIEDEMTVDKAVRPEKVFSDPVKAQYLSSSPTDSKSPPKSRSQSPPAHPTGNTTSLLSNIQRSISAGPTPNKTCVRAGSPIPSEEWLKKIASIARRESRLSKPSRMEEILQSEENDEVDERLLEHEDANLPRADEPLSSEVEYIPPPAEIAGPKVQITGFDPVLNDGQPSAPYQFPPPPQPSQIPTRPSGIASGGLAPSIAARQKSFLTSLYEDRGSYDLDLQTRNTEVDEQQQRQFVAIPGAAQERPPPPSQFPITRRTSKPVSPIGLTTRGIMIPHRSPFMSYPRQVLSASFVGSYEESILNARMSSVPSAPLTFLAQLGVLATAKCKPNLRNPPHASLIFPAHFFEYDEEESYLSPYVGTIDLENGLKGTDAFKNAPGHYRIPGKGQLQLIIKNANKTCVKVFLVPYDLRKMPAGTKTFLRQKCYEDVEAVNNRHSRQDGKARSVPAGEHLGGGKEYGNLLTPITKPSVRRPCRILRHMVHFQFFCSPNKRLYVYQQIRVVFNPRGGSETFSVVYERPPDPIYRSVGERTPVGLLGVMMEGQKAVANQGNCKVEAGQGQDVLEDWIRTSTQVTTAVSKEIVVGTPMSGLVPVEHPKLTTSYATSNVTATQPSFIPPAPPCITQSQTVLLKDGEDELSLSGNFMRDLEEMLE